MEEKDILFLQGLGYTVNEYGGIIDSNGNYIKNVDYNGTIISSFQTKDEYDSMVNKNNLLSKIGFQENPESQDNLETQQEIALAKEHIKEYEQNPEAVKTPSFDGNYIYDKAFEEYQKEDKKVNGGSFPNPQVMQESAEEGTVLADLENEELKNQYKDINSELESIETFDPSYNVNVKSNLEKTREKLKNNKWYNPENISLGIGSVVGGIVEKFTPDSAGMKDEKLQERYDELLEQKRTLLKPVASKKLDKVNNQLEQYKASHDVLLEQISNAEQLSSERLDLNSKARSIDYAIRKLETQKNALNDFIENKDYDTSIFTVDTAADFSTFGISNVVDKLIYELPIANKVEKGEELTPEERIIFDASLTENEVENAQFKQKFWHEVTGGTVESLKFLAGGIGGRMAGKTATRVIGSNLSGIANKVAGTASDLALQTLLHPATYEGALDKYIGEFDIRQDENGNDVLLARERLYNTITAEINNGLETIDEKLTLAKETNNEEEVVKLKEQQDALLNAKKRIKKPDTVFDSVMFGLTETLKEAAAEQYGGKLYNKIGLGKLEKSLTNTKMGKAIFGNKVAKSIASVNNKGRELFNKKFGSVPGEKIIGSNTEEIFEEILVQATPTYGTTTEEYFDQVSELGTLDFYTKVAAQTMLMQKTFQAGGLAKKYYGIANLTKGERAKRKELNNLYKELGNRTLSQDKFNEILMKAGHPKFSKQEYDNTIVSLRKEGLIEEANKMEQNKIYQQAVQAQKIGKLEQFHKSLTKAKYNKNLSPETLVNIEKVKTEVKEMLNDENNYINKNEVIGLKSKKRYADNTTKEIEAEKNKLDNLKINDEVDKILEKLGIEDSYATVNKDNPVLNEYFNKNFDKLSEDLQRYLSLDVQQKSTNNLVETLNKKIKDVTSYDHQTYLMQEEHYFKTIEEINRKNFGRRMTSSDFKNIIDNKSLQKKAKNIKKDRLDEIHKQVIDELESQEKNQNITPKQETKDTEEVITEVSPEVKAKNEVLGKTLENVVINQSNNIVAGDNQNTDNVTVVNNDEIDFLPSDETTDSFKEWVEMHKAQENEMPVFEQFFNDAVKYLGDDKSKIGKSDLMAMGKSWEAAGYGKSNWEDLYSKHYTDKAKVAQNVLNKFLNTNTEEAVTNEVSEEESVPVSKNTPVNPLTGIPLKITPVAKKTSVLTAKANFNSLEYKNNREIVTDKDGNKIIVYTKKDTEEIPVMNEDSFLDIKELLHPDKNNIGAIWTPVISNEEDWGDERLKVSVTKPNGEITEFISFAEWIRRNIPKGNKKSQSEINKIEAERQAELDNLQQQNNENKTKSFEEAGLKAKNKQDGKILGQWFLDNAKIGDTLSLKDGTGYEVTEIDRKGNVTLTPFDVIEGKKVYDYKATRLISKVKLKQGDLFETSYRDNNDNIIVEQYIYTSNNSKDKINAKYDAKIAELDSKMSLEEFQKTDEYIAKVPIYYSDKEGNKLSFVADTDWYNPLNIRDTSKEVGDVVLIDNPTETHKADIQEGKDNTFNLRKQIFDGTIKEVKVESKDGSPWIDIPSKDENGNIIPSKSLAETAPDSKIVFFKGDYFVNLDGSTFDMKNNKINNFNAIKKANKNGYRNYYLSPVNKSEDGQQRWVAIEVQRLNENGDTKAFTEDVETAKYILAANQALSKNSSQRGVSLNDAKAIQSQIKLESGLDIQNYSVALNLVNSLIALQFDTGKVDNNGKAITKKYTVEDKDIPVPNQKGKYFIDALFSSSFVPVQNTNLSVNKSAGISVKKSENGFTVKKLADTYEEFLKTRLFTNKMSYNMGTKEDPAYTHSIQPIIQVEPVTSETPSIVERVEKIEVKEVTDDTKIEEINADALKLIEELGGIEDIEDELDGNDFMLPLLESVDEINASLNVIPGLTLDQQHDVINYLLATISKNYDNSKEMSVGEFRNLIKNSFDAIFKLDKNKVNEQYNNLNEVYQKNPQAFPQVQRTLRILELKENKIDAVLNNYDSLFSKAYLEGMRKGFIPSTVKSNEELQEQLTEAIEDEMYEKDFYKSSNETIHKDKVSKKLRRLFATIPNGQKGFLGLDKHEGYDRMYNTIATIITSPLPTEPTFESMINRLKLVSEVYPWMNQIITELEKSDNDIKASFTSNMYKYAAKASFIAFTDQIDGMNSEVWFSNANNVKQKIKEHWNNEFKRSNITNNSTLNTQKLTNLYNQFESWGENKHLQDDAVLRQWLADFGIPLSDGTWEELKSGKLVVSKGRKKRTLSFEDLFFDASPNRLSNRGDRLFSNLAKYAKANKDAEQGLLDFTQNDKLHPFKDMNNILKSLIEIESKHNNTFINITRRDGDKTVSEIIFPNFFLHNMRKLIVSAENEDGYLDDLSETDFAQNSVILDLLKNNPDFTSIFSYGETGLMSMKKIGSKNPSFSKIDQLSPLDYMFHQRSMFQYMKVDKFEHNQNGFDMRVATISTPTNSDKGRMMLMKTAVYDLFSNPSAFVKQGDSFNFSQEVKELLYESLIVPELNRIVNHTDRNIKDYNKGAIRFNLIPEINTLMADNKTAIDFLKNNKDVTKFKELYFDEISTFLEKSIKAETKSSLEKTKDFIEKDNKGKPIDVFNNKEYLDTREEGTVDEKRYLAELDYTINSMIANMNTLQLIAGDPAMYYKSKGTPTSSDTNEQIKISRDLGTNLGKRLALMIAPGNVLSESQDEKYMQLFLEDTEEVANNAEEIIGWHYGKKSLKEEFNGKTYRDLINELRNKSISDTNLKQLQLRFDKVKDFLTIETTDAQEYTTLKEHLRTLEGQGRISKEKADEILTKSNNGFSLDKEDIETVLQPVKPVYTGDIIENGVRRIIYIKSSSFPLIPDLVQGTKLEGLMNKMNELEKKHGVNVRASYQSANKVGAMINTIDPLSQESLDSLDEVDQTPDVDKPTNALLLDRINFKIQQDVPFKSDLQKEDKVSMGTQIFKLLMGDGIDNINGFELEGKKITGSELKKEFFNAFSSIIDMQKDTLLDELGLEDDYTSNNPLETAKKIQSLLKAEAEERSFSENDIKSLELYKLGKKVKDLTEEELEKTNGNFHFKMPLWFSGNANKFESMLNAIINNRIFKQKLPGNSFVVGSENGLQIKEGIENAGNDVVYIGDYKGGELKGNEVLAPSKIKMNGKLIDLFKKNKNGKYIYIKPQRNGFVINENTISPELFENFTFRTPTSSHGSASNIKIVGFLPTVMGDLMITPKNFIAQMGQDFDIDKLTSYQYHFFDNQGKFERFNEEHRDYLLYEFNKKDNTAVNTLMKSIFDEEVDDKMTYEKLERKLNMKLAQNKFIEIHNSVYKNPSAEVQRKINKVLSMEFAEDQAEAIDNLVNSNDETSFNILSPQYQMDKMIAGSTGSLAIGVYAKGVTFNSLAQQTDKPIKIQDSYVDEEGNVFIKPKTYQFGSIYSDGTFGLLETISANEEVENKYDLKRRTAAVQDERVNTGTDNEKAQILGRVGITHLDAVAVDNFLSLLGIDAERNILSPSEYNSNNPFHKTKLHNGEQIYYTEYSIPYLLHSQPIVKEYFTRLKNAKGQLQDYVEGIDDKIFNNLIGVDDEGNPIGKKEDFNLSFTGDNLVSSIEVNSIDTDFQKQILIAYKELIDDAKKVKDLQDMIDMSNLGKSMWELKDKIQKFQELSDNTNFSNIEELIGTFSKESGLLNLGDGIYFTPKTNQGAMVGTAISLGRNLFFKYFPYYDSYISSTVDNIIEDSGFKGNDIDFKETIFQEIKKYITSATRNGLFLNTPTNERTEIFFDSEDNTSLSTYIATLFNTDNEKFNKGINTIKNNNFISYMSYERGENNKPSLIKFDNTEVANVSEEHFHQSFRELFVKDIPLPDKNGQPYSTRKLAQELVAYSHLSGGIVREAIEFHRFIPIEYYDELQDAKRNVSITRLLQNYDTLVSNWGSNDRLKNFSKQFFQNNPEKATQFPKEYRDKNIKIEDNYLTINDGTIEDYPGYVAIKQKTKSKLKQDKWKLYKYMSGANYKEIAVLGEFGMSEYDYDNNDLKSSISLNEDTVKAEPVVQNVQTVTPKEVGEFKISNEDNVKDILENIANSNISYNPNLSSVAKELMDIFKDKLLELKVNVINDKNERYQGRYNNNTITINYGLGDKQAETFVHEFIHGVTVNEIKQYYNPSWTDIVGDNVPKEIMNLNILFKEYTKKIHDRNPKEFTAFDIKYAKYKAGETVEFTPRELSVYYPTVNIKEFLAVSLSNNEDFIKEASQIPYKKTGMKISEKFIKIMNDLLNRITGVENNLAEQILNSTFETIEVLNNKKTTPTQEVSSEEMNKLKENMIVQPDIFADDTSLMDLLDKTDDKNITKLGNLLPDGIEQSEIDKINKLPECI